MSGSTNTDCIESRITRISLIVQTGSRRQPLGG